MSYCCEPVLKLHILDRHSNKTDDYRFRCCVPAFSTQSRQRCSVVCLPVHLNNINKRSCRSENFRLFYERGDLPCTIYHTTTGQTLKWFIDNLEILNIDYYLPIFTDGLCEVKYPYSFIALQGTLNVIEANRIILFYFILRIRYFRFA